MSLPLIKKLGDLILSITFVMLGSYIYIKTYSEQNIIDCNKLNNTLIINNNQCMSQSCVDIICKIISTINNKRQINYFDTYGVLWIFLLILFTINFMFKFCELCVYCLKLLRINQELSEQI